MNECDLGRTVFEHANGFTMVNTRNIEIPFDFGGSYGGFNWLPLAHITLNTQIPNLSIINQNVGEIIISTSHNFRKQGYISYYNINQDKI